MGQNQSFCWVFLQKKFNFGHVNAELSISVTYFYPFFQEHPDLRYRQGMHELLSSILQLRMDEVICCQKIVQGSAESTTLALIQTLLK